MASGPSWRGAQLTFARQPRPQKNKDPLFGERCVKTLVFSFSPAEVQGKEGARRSNHVGQPDVCANLDKRHHRPLLSCVRRTKSCLQRRKAVGPCRKTKGTNMRQRLAMDTRRGPAAGLVSLFLLVCGCASATLTAVDGGPDAGPDGGQVAVILTITNYQSWCAITVDGDGGYMPIAAFVVGSVVQLDAAPQPGYVWGYWTGTAGDTGSGDRNMATTVTMNTSKQVVACCPQSPPAAQICPSPIP
jgi:hypothetical protein